jgi:cytoskeletal protein CcmA (bactofilin family)
VNGAIYADYRLEAQSTSVITGDINTPRVLVHDGGKLNGRIDMSGKHKKAENKPTSSQKDSALQSQKTEKKTPPFEVVRELEAAAR